MESFSCNRFPGPMFQQNFPRNNFNMNSTGNRFTMQPFQRPPNPAFRPYPPPERYMRGNFQNRPHFSNFPEQMGPPGPCPGPRGRPPPPNQVIPMNPAHGFHRPRGSFERPFRPWIPPPFGSPRPQLQNRPRAPVPSHHMRDLPLHPNKRGKPKIREFRKLKSWMTDELFAEVKKKNTLYLKAKSSDEQTAWQEFRLQRNRVSSLIKEAKIKAGLISRKIKEDDTTVKPFFCDTCDRAFASENELKDHVSQHIQCDHANCTFQAHSKIVALHKKMQHDTGYADRINKLKDDAEIQKWREERKRRFPTSENVKKRKAEQAEKEARGEVLETKEFGKFKRRRENNGDSLNQDFRRRRGRGFKRSTDRRRHFHPRSQPFTINVDSESDSDSDSHITLRRFLGISSLTNSAKEITDEIEEVEVSSVPQTDITLISDKHQSPSQSCEQNLSESKFDNSISQPNLQCTVNNSSNLDKDQTPFVLNDDNFNDHANESICEIPEDESASQKQKNVELVEIKDSDDEGHNAVPILISEENSLVDDQDAKQDKGSDDEGPTALPIVKSVEKFIVNGQNGEQDKGSQEIKNSSVKASDIANTENRHSKNHNKSSRHPRNQYSHVNDQANGQDTVQIARKSSLLEKLLADDIRHERNVILQCIRHIVKNNFFGIESKCLK